MSDEPVDPAMFPKMVELIGSFPSAQYTRSLTVLGVPDELADGPRHVADIASAIGAHEPTLAKYLRSCAILGLLTESEAGLFGLTPLGALLRTGGMFFAMSRATAGMHHYLPYTRIADCVRTGRPMAEATLGTGFFEYLQERPEELLYYYQLVSMTSGDCGTAVAKVFDFSRFGAIVDVGGRHGDLLAQILSVTPDVRAVLFDLPAILPAARAYLAGQGLDARVTLKGGDPAAERPPAGGDLYLLKNVLWETDDERAARILRNTAASMSPSARLLVIESFLPAMPHGADRETDEETRELHRVNFSAFLQRGARVRTEAEYRELLGDAGFTIEKVTGVDGDSRHWDLIEARPA
jgi:hypothetical protein